MNKLEFNPSGDDCIIDLESVTRIEIIDDLGRRYTDWNKDNKTKISIQDDGKTLKVFITKK